MSVRARFRSLWLLVWGLPMLLIIATVLMQFLGSGLGLAYVIILSVSISVPFSVVGVLVVTRQPGQVVGWLIWSIGFIMAIEMFAESYGETSRNGTPLPGGGTALAIAQVFWVPPVAIAVTLLPLLFPTGRLLSPRWRWVGWLAITGMLAIVVLPTIFFWTHREDLLNNPELPAHPATDVSFVVGAITVLIAAIASIMSVVVRFRRASGTERQQLKWFIAGITTTFAGTLATFFAPWRGDINGLAILVLPVTIGVAILRYRLYDIDLIINRAVVYLTLSTSLLAMYLGLVFVLGTAVQTVVDANSSMVTATSTLAVAALFRPLRQRIQQTVDHRFFRSKYDAARTLDAFSTRLRDEIDLDTLEAELRAIVHATMQPSHVTFWRNNS